MNKYTYTIQMQYLNYNRVKEIKKWLDPSNRSTLSVFYAECCNGVHIWDGSSKYPYCNNNRVTYSSMAMIEVYKISAYSSYRKLLNDNECCAHCVALMIDELAKGSVHVE